MRCMDKALGAGAAVALLGLGAMATYKAAPPGQVALPLFYNTTASLPRGLYFAAKQEHLALGDIIRVCVPPRAGPHAVARGYVHPGSCAGGTAPIGKMVVGLPGDTVWVEKDGVRVGAKMRLRAKLQAKDSRGRPVRTAEGIHVLGPGQCFVLSTHDALSYDSRYFGPVRCQRPHHVLRPVSRHARGDVPSTPYQ